MGLAVALTITRTDKVCAERIILKGWRPCGAKILRISMSEAGRTEYLQKTGKQWQGDEEYCLNPSGCGPRQMLKLSGLLSLLS